MGMQPLVLVARGWGIRPACRSSRFFCRSICPSCRSIRPSSCFVDDGMYTVRLASRGTGRLRRVG